MPRRTQVGNIVAVSHVTTSPCRGTGDVTASRRPCVHRTPPVMSPPRAPCLRRAPPRHARRGRRAPRAAPPPRAARTLLAAPAWSAPAAASRTSGTRATRAMPAVSTPCCVRYRIVARHACPGRPARDGRPARHTRRGRKRRLPSTSPPRSGAPLRPWPRRAASPGSLAASSSPAAPQAHIAWVMDPSPAGRGMRSPGRPRDAIPRPAVDAIP